jgi:hypothetical protein
MCAVPTAPAWFQHAGLGADALGSGVEQRGARAEGANVDYAPTVDVVPIERELSVPAFPE